MSFTRSTTDLKVHQTLSDYPNVEDGLSAEELKKKFDAPAEQLQKDLNKLEEELESKTGAANVGASVMSDGDTSENTVQAKLEYLLNQLQNVSLGQIPDGTITKGKLNDEYANIIAEKTGELQKGLNAEKLNGINLAQLYLNAKYHLPTLGITETPEEFTSSLLPAMSSNEQDGFKISNSIEWENLYRLFDKNESTYWDKSSGTIDATIEFPKYVKIKTLKLKQKKAGSYSSASYTLIAYGSTDGTNYKLMDTQYVYDKTTGIYEKEISLNVGYCKCLKLELKLDNPLTLYEIELNSGYTVNSLDISHLDLNQNLDEYEDGLKVSIKVPENYENNNLNATMRIGNLEYKTLPADLQTNEYVDLIYNGTSFVRR